MKELDAIEGRGERAKLTPLRRQITRLEAEQMQRRKELSSLYGSLDTLLGLGGGVDLRNATSVPLPPDDGDLSSEAVRRP